MHSVLSGQASAPPRFRRAGAVLAALLIGALFAQTLAAPGAQATDVAPRMYQDQAFAAAGAAPTEDKPQSKLWFTDGSWWALMRTTGAGADGDADITIHRLLPDHTWRDTGTVVDTRPDGTGDALWEDGTLLVVSRVPSGSVDVARLAYDPAGDTYTMASGFPRSVAAGSIESVTIARDSRGRLWVTFTKPNPADTRLNQVWVAHSTTGDTAWTAPFLVPASDTTVKSDDISAVVAFGGKVGVMWSDQQSQVVRFAVHLDTAPDTSGWTVETPVSGTRSADDHLNLKSLVEGDDGRIYAAIKTSRGDSSTDSSSDPLICVLSRSSAGTWTSATVATVAERLTRPQLALDQTNHQVYVVMSTESGGNVYYRRSPMGASLSFAPRATLLTWSGARINNATTAKAPVTAASGLVVLASDEKNTMRYYHAELDLGAGPAADTTPPSVPTGVSATADTSAAVTVRWTASTDDVALASYRVTRNGTVLAPAVTDATSFVDRTVTAGSQYAYTVSAVDAAGNRSAESAPASVTVPLSGGAGVVTAGSSTVAGSSAAVTAVSVERPAGVLDGDVLITQITTDNGPSVGAAPAGWSPVVSPLSTYGARVFVYFHVVAEAAVEPSSYSWQLSSAQKWNAVVGAFHGVDAAAPFDGEGSTSAVWTSRTTVPVPGVTTSTAGAMLVGGVGVNSGSVGVTEPGGWTEAAEATGVQVSELAFVSRPTVGPTGDAVWSLGRVHQAAGWMRALRPAAAGAPPASGATAPTASFTTSTTSGTAPLEVRFTDTSTGSPTEWVWDFGDGSTSSEQNPAHTYAAAGTYPVTLTATNPTGSDNSVPITITVSAAPSGGAGVVTAGSSTVAGSSAAVTAVSVERPAGVLDGDVLITQITTDNGPSVGAAPAGWSPVVSPLSTYGARVFVYFHVVAEAAAEPSSYSWQLSSAQKWNAVVGAFHGVDAAAPFDGEGSTSAVWTSRTTVPVPGVTTSTAGAMLVGGVGVNSGSVGVTEPGGWTEAAEATGVQVSELAFVSRPTVGPTGDAVWSLGRVHQAAGWMRALRPR